ncbi:MAG: hypothetical protein MK066_06940 [Crocinitomicaceae bacterium]|nr:hypothetical protein [Crocinitomicaceae bacterium]
MRSTILFVCLLILFGCDFSIDCEKISLTKADRIWHTCYSLGDEIVFLSDSSNYDTLQVVNKKDDTYTECRRFATSKYQFNESLVELIPLNCDFLDFCNVSLISTQTESKIPKRQFHVFGLIGDHEEDNLNSINEDIFIPYLNAEIETEMFSTETGAADFRDNVQSFNWSREYGLVSYVKRNGEIFKLFDK